MDRNDSPIPAPIEAIPDPVSWRAPAVPIAEAGLIKVLRRKAPTSPQAK